MTNLVDYNKSIKGFRALDSLEKGSGIIGTGTIYRSAVYRFGDMAKTEIIMDLTGLSNGGAAGDIIGGNDAANCHIGRIDPRYSGSVFMAKMTCLEVPAGGDPDIDVYAANEGTGVENAAITGLTETALVDSGDLTLGSVEVFTSFPTSGQYLYLVNGAGATVFGAFTAGKVLIELWGTL